jgi:hypothetical protein
MSIPPAGMVVLMLMPGCVPALAWAQSPGRTDPRSNRTGAGRGNAGKGNGDAAALAWFVRENDPGDAVARDALFAPTQFAFESLDGHLLEIGRDFRRPSDMDVGPMGSFDEALAGDDPGAHLSDDLVADKLAFLILTRTQVAIQVDRSSRRLGQ